jgi:hypothetical protein
MNRRPIAVRALLLFIVPLLAPTHIARANQTLDDRMHHLRFGDKREWDEFPQKPEAPELFLKFTATANPTEQTLRLRHRDLKQTWTVTLNDKKIATLPLDENPMTTAWPVPPGALRNGPNELRIACTARAGEAADDVSIGAIELLDLPRQQVLSQATVDVTVLDADHNTPLPCRITIADERGSLMDLGIASGNVAQTHLAVRPGVAYSGDGRSRLALAAGRYRIYAGRGFAYSIDSVTLDLKPGDALQRTLHIRRVVPTPGYVSCDTHVHTFTYSRHGDATLEERMLTLAGEGIELPIATDHNLQIDYDSAARAVGVRDWFTPVIGDEVTTAALGHFNVFPLTKEMRLLNWRAPTWAAIKQNVADIAGDPIVILNHARDVHGGFRPFGPTRHLSFTGEDLDGWDVPANAMEVINSGATRNDPMDLFHDWFGMLNRGRLLAPIGASDSHDVSRYIVGQGRTYVRYDGDAPTDVAHLDVARAVQSIREGRVMVSYGLLTEISVNGQYGPGDLVSADPAGDLEVKVRVLGPEWTRAAHVALYANGVIAREADVTRLKGAAEPAGVKWEATWKVPRPKHDVWLVAIASGPPVNQPYWPTAKPYQPTSTAWTGYVLGASGAVRIDADGSGRFDSAHDYATQLVRAAKGDVAMTIQALADYHEATAAQAAGLLIKAAPTAADQIRAAMPMAAPAARKGLEMFFREWDASRERAQP